MGATLPPWAVDGKRSGPAVGRLRRVLLAGRLGCLLRVRPVDYEVNETLSLALVARAFGDR